MEYFTPKKGMWIEKYKGYCKDRLSVPRQCDVLARSPSPGTIPDQGLRLWAPSLHGLKVWPIFYENSWLFFLTRLLKGSRIFHLKRWIALAIQGSLLSCLVVKGNSILSACLVFLLHLVPFWACTLLTCLQELRGFQGCGTCLTFLSLLTNRDWLMNACSSSILAFACISMRPDISMRHACISPHNSLNQL